MKDLDIIARNASIFFLGAISIKLLNYLFRVVGSRGLGTEGYGAFVLSLAIFNIFAVVAMLGIPFGIARYVSHYLSKNQKEDAASAIKSGTLITVVLGIILSVIMFIFAESVATLINHPEITGLIKIFALGLPFFSILTCLEKALEGFKQMKYSVSAMNALHLTKVIAIVIFLVFGFKEEGAVWSYVIGIIVCAVLMVYFLEKKVFPVVKKGLVSFRASQTLLGYSWPLIMVEIANPIISWTDSIILGFYFSTATVGIYSISITTASLLLIFFTSFSVIMFPMMAQHFARKEFKLMKEQYQITTTWIVTLTLPIVIICFIFPEQILTLFYGYEFSKGATVFRLLTAAYLITIVTGPMGAVILGTGRTKMSMFNVMSSAFLNLGLNLYLIPKMGMLGAGIASATSFVYLALLRTGEIYYLTRIQPFNRRFVKPIIATVVSLGALLIVTQLFISTMKAMYVIPISLGYAALYGILLVKVLKLDKEEIEVMNGILQRIGLARFGLRLRER